MLGVRVCRVWVCRVRVCRVIGVRVCTCEGMQGV